MVDLQAHQFGGTHEEATHVYESVKALQEQKVDSLPGFRAAGAKGNLVPYYQAEAKHRVADRIASGDNTTQDVLPGMAGMSPAEPHEQTPNQFLNRPDVMHHAAYVPQNSASLSEFDPIEGFHVGTEKAATDRLKSLGRPWAGTEPRLYSGRVDPSQMNNSPKEPIGDNGQWTLGSGRGVRGYYYQNTVEDPGSVSAVLGHHTYEHEVTRFKPGVGAVHDYETTKVPDNFTTWRQGVTGALNEGKKVPAHVRALYNDTGGSQGPQFSTPSEIGTRPNSNGSYKVRLQDQLPSPDLGRNENGPTETPEALRGGSPDVERYAKSDSDYEHPDYPFAWEVDVKR